jgi:phage baseplate assembly protein W
MDLSHLIGTDIAITSSVNATADLLNIVNPIEGQQRVLRRLLTNPGDYVWQPIYGAGLARFVGQPINNLTLSGTIRQQMKLERAVKQVPPPNVTLASQPTGVVVAGVQYIDADTNLTSALSIPLSDLPQAGA